jgi:hypothetical protein
MTTENKTSFTRLHGRLIKEEGKPAFVQNGKEFRNQMDSLEPGLYDILIIPLGDHLEQMKRRYFVMEAELARHLGFKKVELHEALKAYVGRKVNHEGKEVYESIAEVREPDEMRVRIEELHELAALYFGYVFIDKDEEVVFSWKVKTDNKE